MRMLVTVGSALRMRTGLGCLLALSPVLSLGADSLSSVLNQMCMEGVGRGREKGRGDKKVGDGA